MRTPLLRIAAGLLPSIVMVIAIQHMRRWLRAFERSTARREHDRIDIEDTRRALLAEWTVLLARANGDPMADRDLQDLRHEHPHMALGLVGDVAVLEAFYEAEGEMMATTPGAGLSNSEYDRLWSRWQDALWAIDAQMEKLLEGQAVDRLDPSLVHRTRTQWLERSRALMGAGGEGQEPIDPSMVVAVSGVPHIPAVEESTAGGAFGELSADYDWVELRDSEIARFVDLSMIAVDFELAIGLLTRQVEALQDARGTTISAALPRPVVDDLRSRWNAALVAYARPFMGGTRLRLDSSLYGEQGETTQRRHEHFMGIRNRHVAHSVSELEVARVAVALTRDDPPTVETVVSFVAAGLYGNREQTLELLGLARTAHEAVQSELRREYDRLMTVAVARVQELDALPRVTTLWTPPDSRTVLRPRRQHQRSEDETG